jgi:putative tricarboxylic transport membrane protein
MRREFACGAMILALAVAYFFAAAEVPQSMLSDDVGADGVPKAIAVVLAILGVAQLARAASARRVAGPDELSQDEIAAHLRSIGVIAIGIVYILAAPYLGYPLAATALIFAMSVYAGMPISLHLAAVSVGGGFVMWLMFVKALGIAMPVGLLGRLLG